jgi:hypothetical protein
MNSFILQQQCTKTTGPAPRDEQDASKDSGAAEQAKE